MTSTTTELTDQHRQILDFERMWWKYAGAKEQAIRNQFNLTPPAFYQLLNQLIDNPAALAHDPMLIRRLRRLRENRQLQRAARRLDFTLEP